MAPNPLISNERVTMSRTSRPRSTVGEDGTDLENSN